MKKTRSLSLTVAGTLLSGVISAQPIAIPGTYEFWDTLTGAEQLFNTQLPNVGVVPAPYVLGYHVVVDSVNISPAIAGEWEREPYVRLFNSAFPGMNAYFNFSDVAGVFTAISISSPTVRWFAYSSTATAVTSDLVGALLPAGSIWGVEFYDSVNDGPGPDAIGDSLVFTPQPLTAPAPPAGFTDLGSVDVTTSPVIAAVPTLAARQIVWYRFELPSGVDVNNGSFADMFTQSDGSGGIDSEIGLYTANGIKVAEDDDDGPASFSLLSFGLSPQGGLDGGVLQAGTYYLGVGRFNNYWGPFGFNGTSTGAATTFPFQVVLESNLAASAGQVLSGAFSLADTIFGASATRAITVTVKQGTTTVGSVVVSGISTSDASYSFSVPSSVTGAATLEFDGSSFLRKKLDVNLSGSNQSFSDVTLVNGDVDASGEVDAADIDAVIQNFGGTAGDDNDVDVSGEVDAADIDIVISNFGSVDD